ncbi:MAG: hypothetical protein AVDCRST_MAG16-3218, partial [uncultured Frankineae bacterium]
VFASDHPLPARRRGGSLVRRLPDGSHQPQRRCLAARRPDRARPGLDRRVVALGAGQHGCGGGAPRRRHRSARHRLVAGAHAGGRGPLHRDQDGGDRCGAGRRGLERGAQPQDGRGRSRAGPGRDRARRVHPARRGEDAAAAQARAVAQPAARRRHRRSRCLARGAAARRAGPARGRQGRVQPELAAPAGARCDGRRRPGVPPLEEPVVAGLGLPGAAGDHLADADRHPGGHGARRQPARRRSGDAPGRL